MGTPAGYRKHCAGIRGQTVGCHFDLAFYNYQLHLQSVK
jgi:hypothetical protein